MPDTYAMWRTEQLNFSINQQPERAGQLRHVGFEDDDAHGFTCDATSTASRGTLLSPGAGAAHHLGLRHARARAGRRRTDPQLAPYAVPQHLRPTCRSDRRLQEATVTTSAKAARAAADFIAEHPPLADTPTSGAEAIGRYSRTKAWM